VNVELSPHSNLIDRGPTAQHAGAITASLQQSGHQPNSLGDVAQAEELEIGRIQAFA